MSHAQPLATADPDSPNSCVSSVGWIGAGRMGAAMVVRLAVPDSPPCVWNRTRAKAEALTASGCVAADSIAHLREHDVVFTMVSTAADLKTVLFGTGGLLADAANLPRIVVDSSTIDVESSAEIRSDCSDLGVHFVAAPVSGNAKVVEAGRLTMVVSGDEAAFNEVRPMLAQLAVEVTYAGCEDQARLVKIAHNLMLGVVTQCLAEVTVLAEKGGVPRHVFLDFLNNSVMGSPFTRYKTPAFVNLDYTPTFTPILLRKDFDLGLAAARRLRVPVPVVATTAEAVQASIGSGRVGEDFAILLDLVAAGAGLELRSEEIVTTDGLSVGDL